MRLSLALGCVLLVPGCYLSHTGDGPPPGIDAGSPWDAGRRDAGPVRPRPDAGPRPDGDYWTLEARAASLGIPHELGCTQYEGGRIAVRVTTPINTECEHAGPVEWAYSSDGTVVITAYVWVQHRRAEGACLGTTAISERHVLFTANEGTFRAVSAGGGAAVELRTGAIDDRPCSFGIAADQPCLVDCDCVEGLVCIPGVGDFVACQGGRCGVPCDPASALRPIYAQHLDCDPSEQCREGLGLAAPSCQPLEGGGCDPDTDCGPGLICPPTGVASECVWTVRLSAANRLPCTDDAECEEGLRCVQHEDGQRRCEVPCVTRDMRCPFMHECDPTRWVCEWIGE